MLPSEAAAAAASLVSGESSVERSEYVAPAPQEAEDRSGKSHTTFGLGAFIPSGDLSSLDTGFWGDITFGHRINKFLAIEPSIGFFRLTGPGTEVYGVPAMVDLRLGIPILILEPYAGAGAGVAWVHSSFPIGGSNDDFTYLWNAFLGLEVKLGGLRLGAEYKYLQTGDLGPVTQPPGEFRLEGSLVSLMATLSF